MSKVQVISQLGILLFLVLSTPALAANAAPAPGNSAEPAFQLVYFLIGGLVLLTIVLIIVIVFLVRKFRRY
jgi:heme/copper-type cytochrome/quinol oxidase subunit 2